jgi:hypothetical protein
MVLLQGALLTWCSSYIQQHNTSGRLLSPSLDRDSVVDYVKANFALPSEMSVVRALQRQVHCSRALMCSGQLEVQLRKKVV